MDAATIDDGRMHARSAIAAASRRTGIDFNYLLGQAQLESGMRPDARAATSSATGLYQFVEQSWLAVVKQHGAEHGLGWAADSIRRGANGRLNVADAGTRAAILRLRSDANTAALMAAEHAADNREAIETGTGRSATGTDLYLAHFLGLGGARRFLSAMTADPDRAAAGLFPAAARANRNVFYDRDGSARSLGAIYRRFAERLDRGAAANGATGRASDGLDGLDGLGGAIGMGAAERIAAGEADAEVVLGNGAVGGDRHWIATTLAQLRAGRGAAAIVGGTATGGGAGATWAAGAAGEAGEAATPLRPTPQTARLAYLMLASLGA